MFLYCLNEDSKGQLLPPLETRGILALVLVKLQAIV